MRAATEWIDLFRFLRRDRSVAREHQLRLRPPAGFGDHLMFSAVIAGLKAARPELQILVACHHPEIFAGNPDLNEVLNEKHLKRWAPRELDRYRKITFRPPSERVFQTRGHLIDDMYSAVGLPVSDRPRKPRIILTDAERRRARTLMDGVGPRRVAITPFGKPSVRLPNKLYPYDQWVELSVLLQDAGLTLLQIGTRGEGPLLTGAIDRRDLGYRVTAAVLEQCDLLVTHVSGLMHLATAVGTRCVVAYGAAEHPEISGYPQNVNLYTPIECGPCWREDLCDHHSCMKQLTPTRVSEAVLRTLDSTHVKAGY